MMRVLVILCNFVIWALVQGDTGTTEIRRDNRLLSRKRRYLTFPEGSNFVMTLSTIKALIPPSAPRGSNTLLEIDVPFSLPSDTRFFRRHKRPHDKQKREIFSQLSRALEGSGLNGNACVRRMICEAEAYVPLKGTSFAKDLLSAVFLGGDRAAPEYANYCHDSTFLDCELPLLDFLVNSAKSET